MKHYDRPELTDPANADKIVTAVAATAIGALLGLAATKKVMEINALEMNVPGLESVLAYE
ncbi:MAG: hypothetical protein IJP89_06415 [Synergistaceae bacterium]|nr:hypothetical protein [Synergistaceae bacterium]MBR0257051.1 hypothetical protein [Synergistaceae bacterium]